LAGITPGPPPGLPSVLVDGNGRLWQGSASGGNVSGSCPPGTGGFFLTQWLGLNTVGCSPIFHKTSNDFIGIGTTNPSTELDVNGDINAKLDQSSYQINQNTVLSAFGDRDTYVGFGATPLHCDNTSGNCQ